ncbi:MAG: hypothetical protein IJ593_04325 [Lachnospiraceae bacterium]|nr:hypothetical protein [Lachnospiraceae bacterium]
MKNYVKDFSELKIGDLVTGIEEFGGVEKAVRGIVRGNDATNEIIISCGLLGVEVVNSNRKTWLLPGSVIKIKDADDIHNRNKIFVTHSVHNTTTVINYAADNAELNSFLSRFSVWGPSIEFKVCSDGNHQKAEIEGTKELYDMIQSETFEHIFRQFGVKVTTKYEDVEFID